MIPEAVAQPLDDGAANEHAAFERVVGAPVALPRHRRQQVVARRHGGRPRVEEQEASGAVGIFRHSRRVAGLSEQCRLLIPGNSRDRNRYAIDVGFGAYTGRGNDRRQHGARDIEQRSNSSSQSPVWMLNSSVRLAFDGSVACTRPPVNCQINHESTVPNASSPRSARARAPATLSSSHLSFVPEK
jgi:hypothetical protein